MKAPLRLHQIQLNLKHQLNLLHMKVQVLVSLLHMNLHQLNNQYRDLLNLHQLNNPQLNNHQLNNQYRDLLNLHQLKHQLNNHQLNNQYRAQLHQDHHQDLSQLKALTVKTYSMMVKTITLQMVILMHRLESHNLDHLEIPLLDQWIPLECNILDMAFTIRSFHHLKVV